MGQVYWREQVTENGPVDWKGRVDWERTGGRQMSSPEIYGYMVKDIIKGIYYIT